VDGGAPSTRTGEVVLRDVTESDLALFFEQQRDPVANRMANFPPRDRDAFRAHWTKILGNKSVIKKTILFDGRVAGNIVSFEQDGNEKSGTGSEGSTGARGSPRRRSLSSLDTWRYAAPSTRVLPSTTSPPSGSLRNAASPSLARRMKSTS
jgi:hypothetical protein